MAIRRLLIANRGEIAVRIARTAHQMGIDTVGIYSDPDANALHVDTVDMAVALGGSTPAESYLRSDAVLAAARDTGCDAVHPGYGFLAENAAFAQQVIDAGLIWVGPTPDQIRLLGDKVAAKQAAIAAGVPTTEIVPVAPGEIPSNIPLPALVKAAAGGGGRGMRVVRAADELEAAVESAAREAEAAFGDGTVFIEPYIERGRHIEVQIIGDAHGTVVHLGERECSIQRRNQKVVEESPSAGISEELRGALCDGALALANHVGYENAGTVEFLVGNDGTITFLEVNTRLQVEHPVTEAVTGLDLVELQLRVAAGEPLPITQADVGVDGHAIEVRLVAEDPGAGWMPSTGRVESFAIDESVRVDTGIRPGSDISPDYDSLVAKVISHAPTRAGAARQLARSLRGARIDGIETNLGSLIAILNEPAYLRAETPTAYLDDHPEVAVSSVVSGDDELALLLGAVFAQESHDRSSDEVTGFAPSGWRNIPTIGQRQRWLGSNSEHDVEYTMRSANAAQLLVGPWPHVQDDGTLSDDERRRVQVRLLDRRADRQVVELDGKRYVVDVAVSGSSVQTSSRFGSVTWTKAPRFAEHEHDESGAGPISPLPGTVIAVAVELGQTVADGDLLMVVEAMKMEHKITAHNDAVVAEIMFGVGDRVDTGELLVRLTEDLETEPEPESESE